MDSDPGGGVIDVVGSEHKCRCGYSQLRCARELECFWLKLGQTGASLFSTTDERRKAFARQRFLKGDAA